MFGRMEQLELAEVQGNGANTCLTIICEMWPG